MKANLKPEFLLASTLCFLITVPSIAQERSQPTPSQRGRLAPQTRNVPDPNTASPRSRPGSAVRFNQPHVQVPGRATKPNTSSDHGMGAGVGGSAGGTIIANQGGISPAVAGIPAAPNSAQSGHQPISYPAYPAHGGAGAGGGGGRGVVAPGGSHTEMVIQMKHGDRLYIVPKAGTLAAQRLRAQHEAALRAAATTHPADANSDLNVVPTMSDSEPPPELQPELPKPSETELASASTDPQGLIDLEEAQDNPDENKSKKNERSNVVPISVVSGPLFSNDTLLEWQRQNADNGNPQSQYAMGLRYLSGTGVEKNEDRARDWLEKASKQGELRARAKLRELSKRLES